MTSLFSYISRTIKNDCLFHKSILNLIWPKWSPTMLLTWSSHTCNRGGNYYRKSGHKCPEVTVQSFKVLTLLLHTKSNGRVTSIPEVVSPSHITAINVNLHESKCLLTCRSVIIQLEHNIPKSILTILELICLYGFTHQYILCLKRY